MVIITGMPGAGKTVQGQLIRDEIGFHWLSTGELFRSTNDPEIKAIMQRGDLVSDEHVSKMVGNKLKEIGYDKTFLLDGYPRTVDQAQWLLDHAEEIKKTIKLVLFMVVDEQTALDRLGDRGRPDDQASALAQRQKEAQKIAPTIERLKQAGVPVEEIDANRTVEEIFEDIKRAVGKHISIESDGKVHEPEEN